jgi:hypothetical protein
VEAEEAQLFRITAEEMVVLEAVQLPLQMALLVWVQLAKETMVELQLLMALATQVAGVVAQEQLVLMQRLLLLEMVA